MHLQNKHGKQSCSEDLITEPLPEGKIGSYPYLSFYHCINQFPFFIFIIALIISFFACLLFCISIALEKKINIHLFALLHYKL
jgi:hypothetical protein